jgi:hypothetical protein
VSLISCLRDGASYARVNGSTDIHTDLKGMSNMRTIGAGSNRGGFSWPSDTRIKTPTSTVPAPSKRARGGSKCAGGKARSK